MKALTERIDKLLDILNVTHPEKREDAKGVIVEMCKSYAKQSRQSGWVGDEEIREKAREVGAKFNKVAELDFGAGAEWMREKLIPEPPKKKQKLN